MVEEILSCVKCEMCKNQKPLLDNNRKCDVMWVGLSAKKVDDIYSSIPLSNETNSGKLISEIESEIEGFEFYKTNIVKCLPVDENGKLRYPTTLEMNLCIINLEKEIKYLQPKIVVLLGNKVIESIQKKLRISFDKFDKYNYKLYCHNDLYFVPIHHPSYISVYKRKQKIEYITSVKKLICSINDQFV